MRKDGKAIGKCPYSAPGIRMDGRKEILGLWLSEDESASFWLGVANEPKNRGAGQILIACGDNRSVRGYPICTKFETPSRSQRKPACMRT